MIELLPPLVLAVCFLVVLWLWLRSLPPIIPHDEEPYGDYPNIDRKEP